MMISDERRTTLRDVHTLFQAGTLGGLTDGQLLERFRLRRDEAAEAAFTILVERHGPMVHRVSKSILRDADASLDAFQATFLVLVQKAESLQIKDTIGPWLHQVAVRVASCARSATSRRCKHELRAAEQKEKPVVECQEEDIGSIVHEEVNALPERLRSVVVLCGLEGRTHAQAAASLGCPVGTVQSRLARARQQLRERLFRRGLAPSFVILAATSVDSTRAALPDTLLDSAVRAAFIDRATRAGFAGVVSPRARFLCTKVTGGGFMVKARVSLGALIAVLALAAVVCAFRAKGLANPSAPLPGPSAPSAASLMGPQTVAPEIIPSGLDFGPLRVGSTAEVGGRFVLDMKDEWGDLSALVAPPRFVKVRGLRIREQTRRGKKVRQVELGLAIDTSHTGDFAGQLRIEIGDQQIGVPVSTRVLPSEPSLKRVLVITPNFGAASTDNAYYRPWFDLVRSANLDVSYLDPSVEGLHLERPPAVDSEGRPVADAWLKDFDVILLIDGGSCFLSGWDGKLLQTYVQEGGRLIVGASTFMLRSIPEANPILKPFGLEFTDEDTTKGRATDNQNWAPFPVKGKPGHGQPLMDGVKTVVMRRATPVRVTEGGRGEVLLSDPDDASRGYAAVSRDGGEVIVLGPSLLFGWLGETEEADNVAFLRNLLTKPRNR
jgi:RNA polymerase sigma factor (sigma-70 family)